MTTHNPGFSSKGYTTGRHAQHNQFEIQVGLKQCNVNENADNAHIADNLYSYWLTVKADF